MFGLFRNSKNLRLSKSDPDWSVGLLDVTTPEDIIEIDHMLRLDSVERTVEGLIKKVIKLEARIELLEGNKN